MTAKLGILVLLANILEISASFAGHPSSSPFLGTFLLALSLFCRANGKAQSLERGSFRMDFSAEVPEGTSFPKSWNDCKAPVADYHPWKQNTLGLSTNISQTKQVALKSPKTSPPY